MTTPAPTTADLSADLHATSAADDAVRFAALLARGGVSA